MFAAPTFEFGSPRELLTTLRDLQRSSTKQAKPRLPVDLNEVLARYEKSQWLDRKQERKDRRILPWCVGEGTPPLIERSCFKRLLGEVEESSRGSQICGLIESYLNLHSRRETESAEQLLGAIERCVHHFKGRSRRVLAWKPFLPLLKDPRCPETAGDWLDSPELLGWFDDKPFNSHDRIGFGLTEALARIVGKEQYGRTSDFIDFLNQDPVPPLPQLCRVMNALLREVAIHHSSEPDDHLISYCLRQFGDPHLDNKRRWQDFSPEARQLLSAWIADEDLRLFFDELTGDRAGQERLRFWRAYLDAGYVSYSKIFLSRNDRSGASSKLKEHLAKGRHGALSDQSTSAFLVKIGDYFFIEFSKINNALYIYRPGVFGTDFLTKKNFDLTDLKNTTSALEYIGHNGAWQFKVDQRITQLTGLRINRRALEKNPRQYRQNVALRVQTTISPPFSNQATTKPPEKATQLPRLTLPDRSKGNPLEVKSNATQQSDVTRDSFSISLGALKKQSALLVADVCEKLAWAEQTKILRSFFLFAFEAHFGSSTPPELEWSLLRKQTKELPVLLRHYLAFCLARAIHEKKPDLVHSLMSGTKRHLGMAADDIESLIASATKSTVFHQYLGIPRNAGHLLTKDLCNRSYLDKLRAPYRRQEPHMPSEAFRLVERFRVNRDLELVTAFEKVEPKKISIVQPVNVRSDDSLDRDLEELRKDCSRFIHNVTPKVSSGLRKRLGQDFFELAFGRVCNLRDDFFETRRTLSSRTPLIRHYVGFNLARSALRIIPDQVSNLMLLSKDLLNLSVEERFSLVASAEGSNEAHRLLGFAPKANAKLVSVYCNKEYLQKLRTPYSNPDPSVPRSIHRLVEDFRVARERQISDAYTEIMYA